MFHDLNSMSVEPCKAGTATKNEKTAHAAPQPQVMAQQVEVHMMPVNGGKVGCSRKGGLRKF